MTSFLESIGYNDWALVALLLIPLVGAALIFIVGRRSSASEGLGLEDPGARQIAFYTFLIEFIVSLGLWFSFDPANPGWQASLDVPWIPTWGVRFTLGIDGIALMMVLLTTFIMPLTVLGSWTSIRTKVRSYYALLLILTTGMLGVFMARDLFLFYVMWEVMLVPMYFIIGIWGGERRIYASIKFFIYTMLPSLLMLVAILYLAVHAGREAGTGPNFSYDNLLASPAVAPAAALWLFGAFFAAFAVKVPMFPVHTWLPDAHVEAPTAGSVILAAIMLKIGGYGFLRFTLPIVPDAGYEWASLVIVLSLIGVIYVGLVALVQDDMKKLIAYSSVSHMGFVTLGIFIAFGLVRDYGNMDGARLGLQGAMVQMISHGFISGAMFSCVGVLYDRMHTRMIKDYGGVVNVMPWFAVFFVLFGMANSGLPGTSGFVGEFMVIVASFQKH